MALATSTYCFRDQAGPEAASARRDRRRGAEPGADQGLKWTLSIRPMSQVAFNKHAAASDEQFLAVPGLTCEDAQGDHLYVFGDLRRFPQPHHQSAVTGDQGLVSLPPDAQIARAPEVAELLRAFEAKLAPGNP